jgi:SAM-dependent methyltransferase
VSGQPARRVWDREYEELQVIPSSIRRSPSKALVLFTELLALHNPGRALDAGCGNGRNTIYLAKMGWEVDALDFSPKAIDRSRESAKDASVENQIHYHQMDLNPPLPFPAFSFDLVLDSYVSCHFTDPALQQAYWSDLLRLTKPDGHLFSSLFSVEDEYYRRVGRLIEPERNIVVDPNNGIVKQLYTESQIKRFFDGLFSTKYFAKFEFVDIVLGQAYRRSVFSFVLERKG